MDAHCIKTSKTEWESRVRFALGAKVMCPRVSALSCAGKGLEMSGYYIRGGGGYSVSKRFIILVLQVRKDTEPLV